MHTKMDSTNWGKSLSINAYHCNHGFLTDKEKIQKYVSEIISAIDMQAYGPCYIERFGSGSLEGISAMQFIETSSITVHCDEIQNRIFIDIFSCKEFDEIHAVNFTKEYFQSDKITHVVLLR